MEIFILMAIGLYFVIGTLQIFIGLKMKKEAERFVFPVNNYFVTVIIPIRALSPTLFKNLKSVCSQNYPNFEVLFVAESPKHGAYETARNLAEKYPNTKVLISGIHDCRRTTGKCHNLVHAVNQAKGEVLLFGDSDITYPPDWIVKMTSPLDEKVEGKYIEATTAPFFIEPEGFLGKFVALSVSLVTFTANFTSLEQRFPSYASGASIAVKRDVFEKCEIAEIWSDAYNDDLVFAGALVDSNHHIYNQLALLNHPEEAFSSLKHSKEKLIRWVVTISTFGHKKLRKKVPFMLVMNLQFQVALILGCAMYIFGFSWIISLGIIIAGYIYLVVYRWFIGRIVDEKGLAAYSLLAPISITGMMLWYTVVRLFFRTFIWEGSSYTVKGRYSG